MTVSELITQLGPAHELELIHTADVEHDLAQAQADLKAAQAALVGVWPYSVQEFVDFSVGGNTGLKVKQLLGDGIARTIVRMKAGSSTKAGSVPTTGVNPFRLIKAGGDSQATSETGVWLGRFWLQGNVDHDHHGIRVGYSTGAVVEDMLITGIKGSGESPPAETFALELWHATNPQVRRIEVDGRRADGTPVTASGVGLNDVSGGVFEGINSHHSLIGAAFTVWQSKDYTVRCSAFTDSERAVNHERCSGVIVYDRCDFRRREQNKHMSVNSDQGSARITVIDPIIDDWPFKVWVGKTYRSVPQKQLLGDIKVIFNGQTVPVVSSPSPTSTPSVYVGSGV